MKKRRIILVIISIYTIISGASCVSTDMSLQQDSYDKEIDEIEIEPYKNEEPKAISNDVQIGNPPVVFIEKPIYYPVFEKANDENDIINEPIIPNSLNQGMQRLDYHNSLVYEVYCMPLNVTDIRLEAGEILIGNPIIGDTTRWELAGGLSKEKGINIVHVLIKPYEEELETTLILTTDRRTYYIKLKSFEDFYTPIVSWSYPLDFSFDQLNKEIKADTESDKPVDSAYMSFDYIVKRGLQKPQWFPEIVYDDGSKTYIRLPSGVLQGELPIVTGPRNEMLNYRVNEDLIIIDKLIEKIFIIHAAQKISIEKKRG